MRLTCDQRAIYLHDHLAASTFAVELARRTLRSNEGGPYGAFLAGLTEELEADHRELELMVAKLGVGRDEVKVLAAFYAEKIGRVKLNGRLSGYSPLSRVLELEALSAAVSVKAMAWRSLLELSAVEPRLDAVVLGGLVERAEGQMRGLAERHVDAVGDSLIGV